MNGEGPSSPQSGDSAIASSSLSAGMPTNITPSITLIPIKQVIFIFSNIGTLTRCFRHSLNYFVSFVGTYWRIHSCVLKNVTLLFMNE